RPERDARQRPARYRRAGAAARRCTVDRAGAGRRFRVARPPAGAAVSTRVVLVDDQVLMRTAFRVIFDETPDIEVGGEAGDGVAAVQVVERSWPDVVLMDIRMPGVDGVEATRRIRALPVRPDGTDVPRVLILTTFDLDEYVYAALRAGASGFLLKDAL